MDDSITAASSAFTLTLLLKRNLASSDKSCGISISPTVASFSGSLIGISADELQLAVEII